MSTWVHRLADLDPELRSVLLLAASMEHQNPLRRPGTSILPHRKPRRAGGAAAMVRYR